MAVERITTEKTAVEKTHDKLVRDLGAMPKTHHAHGRKQAEFVKIKTRLAELES